MHRIDKQFLTGYPLHTLSQIHNCNLIADMFDNRQVMSNKHIGKTDAVLKIHHKIQDLSLD